MSAKKNTEPIEEIADDEVMPMKKGALMGKRILPDGTVAWIIHEMPDGTMFDSVAELGLPYNKETAGIYDLRVSMMKDYLAKKALEKQENEFF